MCSGEVSLTKAIVRFAASFGASYAATFALYRVLDGLLTKDYLFGPSAGGGGRQRWRRTTS